MPVTAIRLQNFMAFEDTGWIELRPITLLFGRNSSGKSAIFRALRLLKQSLKTHADEGPLRFNDEDGIDLGSFTEMIHRQDGSRPLRFGFRCEPLVHLRAIRDIAASSPQVVKRPIALDSDWAELELSFALESEQVQLSGISLSAQSAERNKAEYSTIFAASHLPAELSHLVANNEWYFASESLSSPSGETPDDLWTGIELTTATGFFPRLIRSEVRVEEATELQKELSAIQSLLDEMRHEIREFLSTLAFMDAIRPEPQRTYTFNRSTQRFWEARGLRAFLAFLSGKLSTDILDEADRWLARLDLGAEVRASRRPSKDDLLLEFQVQIRESAGELFAMNLRDVGAGAGQVLPIIIQAIAAEPGVMIASEQPELHLHPRAQADLADLFVQTALGAFTAPDNPRTDRREGTAISYLIETHSEHLILRLQKRIRERLLPSDYLKVFYIVRDKGVSHCYDLRIDHEGDFVDRWPEGFFEERYAELFAAPRLT